MEENVSLVKRERRNCSRIGWALLALTVISTLAQYLVVLLLNVFGNGISQNAWGLYAELLLPQYLLGFPAFLLILSGMRTEKPEKDGMGFGTFLCCFLMCMPLLYGGNLIGTGLSALVGMITGETPLNAVEELILDADPLSTLVFAVILGPIMEEIAFRKLLIDRLRIYGDKTAILMSGLLFGLYHGNLYQFFYAAAIGCFFAYLYCRYGKLRITMGLHVLVNFIGSVVPLFVMKHCGDVLELSGMQPDKLKETLDSLLNSGDLASFGLQLLITGVYGALVSGGCAAGVVLWILKRKKAVLKPASVELPGGGKTLFVNAGMLLALAALGALLLANLILV